MNIFNRIRGNCGGQFQAHPILTPAPNNDATGDLTGFEGCEKLPILQQNFYNHPPGGHRKTSPLREMVRHGRLSDCFEFLANYYDGMGTDEALDVLRRFRHG
jgi:hypothetical protein